MKLDQYKVFQNMLGTSDYAGIPEDLKNASLVFMDCIKNRNVKRDVIIRLAASFLNVCYDDFWKSAYSFTNTPPVWWERLFPGDRYSFPKELMNTDLVDHYSWLKNKKTGEKILLLQPYGTYYHIDQSMLKALTVFCEKYGLYFTINGMSPHFASHTINVFIRRKKDDSIIETEGDD